MWPGTVSTWGVTVADDRPTEITAATGDDPGLATDRVTVPPRTAVVWANRQTVAGPGVPATRARPEPVGTTIWSSSVATIAPDDASTRVATTRWFWT